MHKLVYIGIPSVKLDTVYATQRNSQWCWAAAIEIILRYYGVRISQEAIVHRAYGIDPTGRLPNREGTYEAMAKNLNNWGIDFEGQFYIVRASFHWGPPSEKLLIRELSHQHPVLLSYISRTFPRLAGHAVVCTGLAVRISPSNQYEIATVVVRDPWPSRKVLQQKGRIEYPARTFLPKITSYWLIRVERQTARVFAK